MNSRHNGPGQRQADGERRRCHITERFTECQRAFTTTHSLCPGQRGSPLRRWHLDGARLDAAEFPSVRVTASVMSWTRSCLVWRRRLRSGWSTCIFPSCAQEANTGTMRPNWKAWCDSRCLSNLAAEFTHHSYVQVTGRFRSALSVVLY